MSTEQKKLVFFSNDDLKASLERNLYMETSVSINNSVSVGLAFAPKIAGSETGLPSPPIGENVVTVVSKPRNVKRLEDDYSKMIVDVAVTRNKEAFGALFSYFAPRIKGFCQGNGTSADRAEEVVQEAMVNIWRKAHLYDPKKASAGAWIFAIARNARIDLIRKENRPEVDAADPSFLNAEQEDTLSTIDRKRNSDRLRKIISQLPSEQSLVLRLAFFEEKPHPVIAEELAIPLGTVKSRIRLAFRRLKKELGEL